MQYGRTAFSKNTENTMEAISDPNMKLGGDFMTQEDVNELNTLYDCGSKTIDFDCNAFSFFSFSFTSFSFMRDVS